MTRRGALLLLVVLLAGASAAPPGPAQTGTLFKCCRDKRLEQDTFFNAPDKVTSLDLCKAFCQENKYGSPVFRTTGWGCSSSKDFSCNDADKAFCDTSLLATSGYYRLYALSSLVITKIVVKKKINSSSTGSIDTQKDDAGLRKIDILGGSVTDAFRRRGLDQIDRKVDGFANIDKTSLAGVSLNFGGRRSTNIGNGVFQLGGNGSATAVITRVGSNRTISSILRINNKADTESTSKQDFSDPNGVRNLRRTADLGSITTAGQHTDTDNVSQNTTTTTVDVNGTASLDTGLFLDGQSKKSLGIDKFGVLTNNVKAVVIRGTGVTTSVGTGRQDTRRSGDRTTLELRQDNEAATLRRKNTISEGSQSQKSKKTSKIETETDRTVIDKKGVGSIDQTKNNTAGNRDNTTSTVDVVKEHTTINTTAECPNCIAVGRQTIRSNNIRDSLVDAKNRFNDTKVSTTTKAAGGGTLFLEGQTRREQNSTEEDVQTSGRRTIDHGGRSQRNCDKKTGVCEAVSEESGKTITVSRNSSKVTDVTETEQQVITVASLG